MKKRIAIMTTGGDCSGLNTLIPNLVTIGKNRGHEIFGILEGTDGLTCKDAPEFIDMNYNTIPLENARMAGSFLKNGVPHALNFNAALETGQYEKFKNKMTKSLRAMRIDSILLIGGNGSLSLANNTREIYGGVQLVGIPKTIDNDVPLTDRTVGFSTAVQQLTSFCDQLLMNARSHHRWFVVQSMGRRAGKLALQAGIASGADAILIPEIKFTTENVISHIQKIQKTYGRDYGIIMIAEGISLRGRSGQPAEIISRDLTRAGITNRTSFPEHFQRVGDTAAIDRLLATRMAVCAMDAIDNNETYVMVAEQGGVCTTISLSDMIKMGKTDSDPNLPDVMIAEDSIMPDNQLLAVAVSMGIYIGDTR